jgi:integrase
MPNGVELHGKRLRIYFRLDGELCRETLDLEPTPTNIAHAERMAALINHEIRAASFDCARWFPNSARLQENTLGAWLDTWLEIKARQVANSTMIGYSGVIERYIRPRWGAAQPNRIDTVDIERWISEDLDRLHSKTIKETIAVLHQVYDLYRSRNPGANDPTTGVKVRLPDREPPDPFTREEIAKILETPTDRAQELNLVRFMIWSGPRVSEAIALAWEDVIDLEAGLIRFRRAKVRGKYRVTKTRRSDRVVELLKPARQALLAQHAITANLSPEEMLVVQRDNRTSKEEVLRPVFRNSHTGRSHYDDFRLRDRFFRAHLKAAGVRYRGPGQCRHTFASQMLTADIPTSWILEQMGHTSEKMFRERYGAWIREDAQDARTAIVRQLGL